MTTTMTWRFGNYLLREESRELLCNGEPVRVTAKSFAVLQMLVRARGAVVSKEELLAAVWSDSFVDEGSVAQNIFVLRKLLAEEFPGSSGIETVGRMGYQFRPTVTEAVEAAPAAAMPEVREEPAPAKTLRRGYGPRLAVAALLLVVMAAVTVAGVRVWRSRASARTASVAVLPFRNLGGSRDADWMADALREMLNTDLANGTTLRTIPEETVDRAARELGLQRTDGISPETAQRLRRDLGCDRIVTGSFVQTNGEIRLDVRLLDARSGDVVTTSTIVRRAEYLEPLAAEASNRVRTALKSATRGSAADTALAASTSSTPGAYQLYQEGRAAARAFDNARATDLLRQSIALDDRFALSHMALADVYERLGESSDAAAEAERGTALSSSLAREQQLEFGAIRDTLTKKFNDAGDKYRALFALHPENPRFAEAEAQSRLNAGNPKEAISRLKAVLDRFPAERESPGIYGYLTDAYGSAGDWPHALEAADTGARLAGERGALIQRGRLLTSAAQARLHLHEEVRATTDTEEALAIAKRFGDFSGELRASNRLAQIYIVAGRETEARALLEQALQREEATGETYRRIHTLSTLGELAAKSGDHRMALSYYQRQLALAEAGHRQKYILSASVNVEAERGVLGEQRGRPARLKALLEMAERIGDKDAAETLRKMVREG